MTNFAELKKSSGKKSLEKLTQELAKTNTTNNTDERFWYPKTDKVGNGYAIIRFLPAPEGEDIPYAKLFSHSFKGPSGKWYIENSPSTIGKPDPIYELNNKLWATGLESDKNQARNQSRKMAYITNIYVVHDSISPENEGKVFLFNVGKKIFDKILAAMNPEFADDEPMNPFDLWEGANFKIKIRQDGGFRNYDRSEFDKVKPLFPDDEKMEAVWKKAMPLLPFLSPSNFKSYDELKAKMQLVLDEDPFLNETKVKSKPSEDDHKEIKAPKGKTKEVEVETGEEEDELEFFKKLAND